MRRILTWSLRVVGVLGVIVSITLLIYVFAARSTARNKVLDALREMGIDDATLEVRSIGTNHLQITNLNMGDEAGLRIGAVGVGYDITSPSSITVETIEIIGAQLDLRMRDGKLDMGPLADIKTSDEPGYADDDLPFDVVRIRASSLILDWNGRRYELPIEATLTHQGAGVCAVEAHVTVLGVQWPFTGSVDFSAPPSARQGETVPATAAARPVADGISFDLSAPVGEQSLALKGQVGGPSELLDIAMKLPAGADAAAPFELTARHHRDAEGSKLRLQASGNWPDVDGALAGQRIISKDTRLLASATINLATANAIVDLSAASNSLLIDSIGNRGSTTNPRFATVLSVDWTRDLAIKTTNGARLSFDELQATVAGQEMRLAETALVTDFDLLIPAQVSAPPRLAIDSRIDGLAAHSGSNQISADQLRLSMLLTTDQQQQLVADGFMSIRDAAVRAADAQVAMSGIDATIPIRSNVQALAKAGADPVFKIASIQFQEDTFAAITGTIAMSDGVLTADLLWPLLSEPDGVAIEPATVQATVDLRQGLSGRIAAKVQDLHLTDDTLLSRKLEAAKTFRVTGHFGLDAEITFGNGGYTPRITLSVRDATFTSGELDFEARGITTSVTLDSLAPLTTLPNQRLIASSGHLGALNFTNAIFNFRMDAIDAMTLELAAWSVGEKGRFWVHAARFNPMKPVLETQVFIEDMSVAEWLSIIQDGEAQGEGYLYGRLPIRVDQDSELILTFGEGFLYAKPGGGWIKLSDRPAVKQQAYTVLEEAIASVAAQVRPRLLEAVNNFQYDRLTFDFIRQNNTVRCVVTTSGRGRIGFKQEVGELKVNINNFGALLSKQFLRSTDSVGAIDDVLQRLFDE